MSIGLRAGTNNDGYLQVNGTDVLTALSSGSIGIGTDNPSNTLHVQGVARFNNSSNNLVISTDSGNPFVFVEQNAPLLLGTNSTEKLRITSGGNVGIGTINPGGKLEVYSGTNTQSANTGGDNIIVKDSDGAGISIFSGDGNSQNIYLGSSSSNNNVRFEGFYNGGSPYFKIHVAGSEAYQVDNNLNVLPGADATQDFGSPTKRWANIYSADLQLSNEGSQNDVDGTWGTYTIQEGEDDLFLLNRRNGKKYKFVLQEVN